MRERSRGSTPEHGACQTEEGAGPCENPCTYDGGGVLMGGYAQPTTRQTSADVTSARTAPRHRRPPPPPVPPSQSTSPRNSAKQTKAKLLCATHASRTRATKHGQRTDRSSSATARETHQRETESGKEAALPAPHFPNRPPHAPPSPSPCALESRKTREGRREGGSEERRDLRVREELSCAHSLAPLLAHKHKPPPPPSPPLPPLSHCRDATANEREKNGKSGIGEHQHKWRTRREEGEMGRATATTTPPTATHTRMRPNAPYTATRTQVKSAHPCSTSDAFASDWEAHANTAREGPAQMTTWKHGDRIRVAGVKRKMK